MNCLAVLSCASGRLRRRIQPLARGVLPCVVAVALFGCATRGPQTQVIDVLVEADDPAWGGPLQCEASNSAGRWRFAAPGAVTVLSSKSPLQIKCTTPSGETTASSTTPSGLGPAVREDSRKGSATGAKVGTSAGVALGVAAAPVMGPAFAVLLAAGSAIKGAEIGGLVGTIASGSTVKYPTRILLRIRAATPGAQSGAAD